MIPKEKAEELIDEFIEVVTDGNFPSVKAKQCALIAVDVALEIMRNEYDESTEAVQYWKDVKQEIEKL